LTLIPHGYLYAKIHCQKARIPMTIYGYARVSTNGQDLAAQDAQLRAAGAVKVHKEKVSGGAGVERPELKRLMRRLVRGDVVLVTRLDRLARSTRDLLNIVHAFGEVGAKFRSLGDPWADTTTPHGELMVTILAGLATFERHLIAVRTREGHARARERGVKFGRPSKLTPHQEREARERLAAGEVQADVARSYNVSQSVISRLVSGRR
jgi:DNA invertase Pin-like site-specific DNA recombinase